MISQTASTTNTRISSAPSTVPVPALTTMPRKLSPPTTRAATIMKMIQVAVNGQWNSASVTDDTR
jgi:hypothetical protein